MLFDLDETEKIAKYICSSLDDGLYILDYNKIFTFNNIKPDSKDILLEEKKEIDIENISTSMDNSREKNFLIFDSTEKSVNNSSLL